VTGTNSHAAFDNNLNFNNNYRYYRYSEALLNAAELLLKTGGSAATAAQYVSQVRQRAGLDAVSTVTIDDIIDERDLEFMGEGKRYWDLVRTGKAATVLVPDQYGYRTDSAMGATLLFVVYLIITLVSIVAGGLLPKYFMVRRGMEPYAGRLRAMLMFAFLPVCALLAQPLGTYSAWWPAIFIGLAGAGHQSWSANLYNTIGDMFPKSAVATITGIGTMTGGIISFIVNWGAGILFDHCAAKGPAFNFLGFEGKEGGYMIIFCYCAVAYLFAWACMKILVPRYKPVTV